jgi:hypothetical protein
VHIVKAIGALVMVVRLCFLVLLVLGIGFWTGRWSALIPLHMIVGVVLVLSLWTTAGVAAAVRVSTGFVAAAFVWGLIVIALGVTQTQILPGGAHWVIQALHLLVGMVAIGMNEGLARRARADVA